MQRKITDKDESLYLYSAIFFGILSFLGYFFFDRDVRDLFLLIFLLSLYLYREARFLNGIDAKIDQVKEEYNNLREDFSRHKYEERQPRA
jgi:hypothetical protein